MGVGDDGAGVVGEDALDELSGQAGAAGVGTGHDPADPGGGIHRVLLAFDGSEGAWAALGRAIDLAVANRALLTIAAVAEEPIALWLGYGAMNVPYTREMIRYQA